MKVGLHQGSALSPLLFITVMDVISELGRGPVHAMLFVNDLVICEQEEEHLKVWRKEIEKKVL